MSMFALDMIGYSFAYGIVMFSTAGVISMLWYAYADHAFEKQPVVRHYINENIEIKREVKDSE